MIKYTLNDQHGHGAISLLLEELDLHIALLVERPEQPRLVIRECEVFCKLLAEELSAHFEEEESTLFPQALARGGPDAEIRDLVTEHAHVLQLAERLTATVRQLIGGPTVNVAKSNLAEQLHALSSILQTHMDREERVFRRVEA